jgi:hypothetical protein
MERYMLPLRILITLLLLTMLLPGWGPLNALHSHQEAPDMRAGTIGALSPFDR